MTRREFLGIAGAAAPFGLTRGVPRSRRRAVTTRRTGAVMNPLGLPFGFQAWELGPDMRKDWDGTLKAMKDYGYSYIDLNQVSPFTDRPAADLKGSFASHGFTFTNALWPYPAFSTGFDKMIADSHTLGLSTIVCS